KMIRKNLKFYTLTLAMFFVLTTLTAQQQNRWEINKQGGVTWEIDHRLPHRDHIEMSGKQISAVVEYGVEADKTFYVKRNVVWPMLRTIPNNTHASLTHVFSDNIIPMIKIDGDFIKERVKKISLNGTIEVRSTIGEKIVLIRTLFPSTGMPVFCENYRIKNNGTRSVKIEVPEIKRVTKTNEEDGVYGVYTLTFEVAGSGTFKLEPGKSLEFFLTITGEKLGENYQMVDNNKELKSRKTLVKQFWNNLVLETPDSTLNRGFAKIRAAESIYETKGGPMHGPGGLSYYAAIWANDQAEYVNPFFPYLGYKYGIESAVNSYKHFARFMNDEFEPIPSSIIAEGVDIWNGAKDRGDAAMIAYGATRFAMSLGDWKTAEKLWPLIEWTLEYNKRKLNVAGVVNSDTDELEGRFPAGNANLCTSSLYYDALNSAVYLGESLEKNKKQLDKYRAEAATLKQSIENYFGATVMGYETYRYYERNKKLRAWICIPLTMGIFDRKEGTINALFSPELWTEDGLATESGDKTFWDRATLYALRGVLAAGETKRGIDYLEYYTNRRLLGEHVPYPVEAYPEGGQRHLSAESGLYCRIYTEGLFGIRPTGLNSFNLTPRLAADWNEMSLRKIHAFGELFDIEVSRTDSGLKVIIRKNGTIYKDMNIASGETIGVQF
ncbi:MAG: hypothetical protein L3J54_11055, partial [Draconibacterium sp.]|nr:hypothetical protein [Draconibacterium sp.]